MNKAQDSNTGSSVLLADCTVAYERHPAIHHISGQFDVGSLTAVVGPNGAGKSTLLKLIAGLLRPSSGRIETTPTPNTTAYLPQQGDIDRSYPITVGDAVLFGLWRKLGWTRPARESERKDVAEALAAVGLRHFEHRPVSTLSAGQFQRMVFARLMLQDARLILLDEPFTALDAHTTQDLLRIVINWHREGRSVIAVLHDFEQVRAHFPETLLLARTVIAWGPTRETLTPANQARAQAMAEAWDEDAEACLADARSAH